MTRSADERSQREAARWRSAYHECGHGLLGFLLNGRPPELLSLRPGKHYNAIAIGAKLEVWKGDVVFGAPSILQPDSLRSMLERSICISLAGDLAAVMAGYRDVGYVADSEDELVAKSQAEALAALSPRRRELLAAAETGPAIPSDDEQASSASFALTGNHDESFWHLVWLRTVTAQLLVDHAEALRSLAEALHANGVMDAAAFLPIVRASRCTCHRWPIPKEEPMPSLGRKPKLEPDVSYASQYSGATVRLLRPIPPERRVRATGSLRRVGGFYILFGGEILDSQSEIVKAYPHMFEPAPEDQ
jgi:hypothetical protein